MFMAGRRGSGVGSGGGSTADGQTVPVANKTDWSWVLVAIPLLILAFVVTFGVFDAGRLSERSSSRKQEHIDRTLRSASFSTGDRVVILIGRLEGQVMESRYDGNNGVEYLVKFQKWIRAEGPIIERSEAVEQWFKEFELCGVDEAPPFFTAWRDYGNSGRRDVTESNDLPPPPVEIEDIEDTEAPQAAE